ncbi:response regulator, partial [Acidobacteria bacterium AH-259-A15]|nr:response regulator [Acidobacteria bacterium AH-259-A15]
EGFAVATAVDGEEALQKIPEEKPDLILLDIMMPKINGYQVCRQLKANPETQAIPVMMLTAKCQESDEFWAKETGADDYVTKPCVMEELMQKIQDHLQGGADLLKRG